VFTGNQRWLPSQDKLNIWY